MVWFEVLWCLCLWLVHQVEQLNEQTYSVNAFKMSFFIFLLYSYHIFSRVYRRHICLQIVANNFFIKRLELNISKSISLNISKAVFKFTLMFYLFKQIAEVENLFYGRLFTFSVSGKVTKSSVVRIFLLFNFVLFRAVGISLNYHLAM